MPNPDPQAEHGPRGAADGARAPASLARRALATAVDLACAALIGYGLRAALMSGIGGPGESAALDWMNGHPRLAWGLTVALPGWLALSALEALPGRAGPGKRLLGLRIAGPRAGQSPSFARILLRTAIKLVPWQIAALALLFPSPWDPRDSLQGPRLVILLGSNLWLGIYLAVAAMTRRRQSLHDLATGTVVVPSRPAETST